MKYRGDSERYEFKSTGNKQVDRIIKQYDKQIKKEYKAAGGDRNKCISYWRKLCFLKTLDLNTNDWRKIRSGDYWLVRDSLDNIEGIKFTIKRVVDYLKDTPT